MKKFFCLTVCSLLLVAGSSICTAYGSSLNETLPVKEEGEIRGYVAKRDINNNELTFQTVYPYGRAMLLSRVMELPAPPERVSNFNIIWYVTYAEMQDNELFEEFKGLLEVRTAINKRIKEGNRKVSDAEFKACRRLMEIKDTVLNNVKWKSGSLPSWKNTTDAEGNFSFMVDNFPGKRNVIYLIVHVAAFPPEGEPSSCYLTVQSPGIGTSEYSIGWKSPEILSESEVPPDMAVKYPLKRDIEAKRKIEKGNLEEARKDLEEVSEKWPAKPVFIEDKFEDRALKGQRALEENYVRQYGNAKKWPDKVRKRFEAELAAIPEDAKRTWERDKSKYERDRKTALEKAGARLERAEEALSIVNNAAFEMEKKRNLWYERLLSTIGDIRVIVPENAQAPPHIFTAGGDMSGSSFTPLTDPGEITRTFLVKQVIDGDIKRAPVVGKYVGTGESAVFYDPGKEASPSPPFEFKLEPAIKEHKVIYDRQRLLGEGTGAGEVYTLFEGLVTPDMLPARLERLFVPLPPIVEVESFPISDSEEFHKTVDAFLEEYDNVTEEASEELDEVVEDRKSGTLSMEEAGRKRMEITRRWQERTADVMRRMNDYTKDNPAFRQ